MPENEQIEEMTRDLCHVYPCKIRECGIPYNHRCKAHIYATRAIGKGYRKVARGHWITREEIGDDWERFDEVDTCSVCGHCDWDCTESRCFNFCPYCGADMRGEVE